MLHKEGRGGPISILLHAESAVIKSSPRGRDNRKQKHIVLAKLWLHLRRNRVQEDRVNGY